MNKQKSEFYSHAPCVNCGTLVAREDIDVTLKHQGGVITLRNVPHYMCQCGLVFSPSEVQKKILELEKALPGLKLKGHTTIEYPILHTKGVKGLRL